MNTDFQDEAQAENSFSEQAARAMVYYAAERTLMSWLRASLGMMALGFVIDRLGLVLVSLQLGNGQPSVSYSLWTGSALIFAGAAMALVAAGRYWGIERRYRLEGVTAPGHGLPLGIAATISMALIGIVIGVVLLVARI